MKYIFLLILFFVDQKSLMQDQSESRLDQFHMLSVIGKGSYAKVMLVRKKDNQNLYALKAMKKKYIELKKQEGRIMMQKNILKQLNHPFLVHMHSSFQSETKLFFVLEYCPGGQLFGLLSKKKRLTQPQVRFYSAQMILAIEYLHSKNIIYRDLKPENVLIDEQGFIKLTDFGLSKNNISEQSQAFSVCGTPEYLAPQIVKKQGHGKAVDWWCLGSIIYELVHGLPPFYSKNRAQLFDKIKNQTPYYSKNWSKHLRDLMQKLFEKDPSKRMQYIPEIKNHPFFFNLDWDLLLKRQVTAPFVPFVNGESDVSNFDKEFTECNIHSFNDSKSIGNNLEGFSFQKGFSPTNPENVMLQQGNLDMESQQCGIKFEMIQQ